MRFSTLAVSLTALVAVILVAYADTPDPSLATSPPSAQRFTLDMDPAGWPGNTATSLGSRESCASMIENDILDGDEDLIDTVEFDVTVTGIPASNAMTGYTYSLNFPTGSVRIVSQQPMLIGPPVTLSNGSDPLPDATSPFNASVLDPSGPAEDGSGVLDRLRIQTFPASVTGAFPLSLDNAAHIDTNGIAHSPDAIDNATIEISGGCGGLADVELVSMSLASSSPIPIGADSTVTVDMTVRNNGPERAWPYATTSFEVPTGCTVNDQSGTVDLYAPLGVLYAGQSAGHQETPSLRCASSIGPFQMPVTACGVDYVNTVDANMANNCMTQNLNFDVVAPPGTDADSDGVFDLDEFNCGVSSFGVGIFPERLNGLDDDGDTEIDEALPPGSEAHDCDGDGYVGTTEAHVFGAGQDQARCGGDNWPADIATGGIPDSTGRVNVGDLVSFIAPTRHLNTNVGDNPGNVRWDLVPGKGVFPTDINVTDLTNLVVVTPPMYSGVRAWLWLPCTP